MQAEFASRYIPYYAEVNISSRSSMDEDGCWERSWCYGAQHPATSPSVVFLSSPGEGQPAPARRCWFAVGMGDVTSAGIGSATVSVQCTVVANNDAQLQHYTDEMLFFNPGPD